ncbi:hypothetical protein IQ266_26690 [filamentous cyanobacterium LEGE 11480]|uniref:Uncharacterized protein n=1 Tax=Romeriopsis navalis LEGE 11480 TaxID=2777977 RepID=A0A928VUJ1_9CYAN|nr:hypothetical protein [Romeriopsis navalis]MBE9033326.1 hypothetical protein [Romeriopsis navalis LEGE 11480]
MLDRRGGEYTRGAISLINRIMLSRRWLPLLVPFALWMFGCDPGKSIQADVQALLSKAETQTIDFATVGPEGWQKMCVLSPYTDNAAAKQVLGVVWDAEKNTKIADNDGIYVLAFVAGDQVTGYAEMPRQPKQDLLSLKPPCVDRSNAKLKLKPDGTWETALK